MIVNRTIHRDLVRWKKTIGIIGWGPAGMSGTLWLKYLGFDPIIIEKKQQLGGLQQVSNFQNVYFLGLFGKNDKVRAIFALVF